jgi:peptidyl-prolyl cis-trans isomerase C
VSPLKRVAPCVVALALLVGAALPVVAEDQVVARVNGRVITEADVRLAEGEIGNDIGSLLPPQRRRVLIEYLIENMLFAEAAEAEKLGSGQSFDERMRYWQRRALRDTYFDRSIKDSVTEADARKFYDAEVARSKPEQEVHARHILVESEEQAKEIYEKIAHGEDFAKMAKQFSKDPGSKEEGGDLGFFGRGRMVPEFEQAAFKLEKGDVSLPVRTQFGWHLIRVEEKRELTAPPFEQIKDRIMASLIHRKAQQVGASLRQKATLEFVDPAIREQVERERAIRPVPGGQPKR